MRIQTRKVQHAEKKEPVSSIVSGAGYNEGLFLKEIYLSSTMVVKTLFFFSFPVKLTM